MLLLMGYGPRTAGGNTRDGAWDDGHIHYFTHKDLRELFLNGGFSEIYSEAIINNPRSNLARRLMDKYARTYIVREFLSGNIMLYAVK